jgi:hypothetical protein
VESIPEGKGRIHIRTFPKGASIEVDGHVAPKKTDVQWDVDPGTYDIGLRMDGYKSVRRSVKVEKGKIRNVDEVLEKQ